jgi:hypothetical protein
VAAEMIDLPEDYFKADPALIELQRQMAEFNDLMFKQLQVSTTMSESQLKTMALESILWPEIIYEDILDAEVLND